MNGTFSAEYWKACETELKTLEEDMNVWTLVKRTPDMNVLPGTWALKCKQYPDGTPKKHKARFCVRGDRQIHGVDFFETWAPVVQWSTIRSLMILAVKEKLISAQCDITAAFVHATLPVGEEVYVHQPRGFNRGKDYVLKLSKSLYGMRQSPRYFFKYLTEHLEQHCLKPFNLDPCMFASTNPGLTNHKIDGTQIGESPQNVAADPHALIVIIYVDAVSV